VGVLSAERTVLHRQVLSQNLAGLPGPSVIHDTCIETGDRKEEAVAEQ